MTKHLSHEEKVAFLFGLDEGEARAAVARHLSVCAACRDDLARLKARERGLLASGTTVVGAPGFFVRAWRSRLLPLAVLAATVLTAAVPAWDRIPLPSVAMVLGAAVVAAWLHSLLRRAETTWRRTRTHLRDALPDTPGERARFLEGVRLSVARDLQDLRGKLSTVVLVSLAAIALGAITLIAGQLLAPEIAARAVSGSSGLISLAAALVLLMGSAVWCGLRLRYLARQLLELLEAEFRELASRGA